MAEINIARTIVTKRREKGMTQEELAEFMGVSKASVSKWETGQSFPDIALLPKLASFFNISIDELMDFRPEMTQEEIRRFHRQTAAEFTCRPFNEVIEKCRRTAQAYYSCFPLLFQIGSLMINHSSLAGSPERSAQILEEAAALFHRVRIESRDASLAGQALSVEAYCLISLQRPDEALDLLGRSSYPYLLSEPLIASAWQMKGQPEKAAAELQAGIYQNIIGLMNLLSSYLGLCAQKPYAFAETYRRICGLADIFQLAGLNPGVLLSIYLGCASGFLKLNDTASALDALDRYVRCASGNIFPIRLHGDEYFDLLDEWLENRLDLGSAPPRDANAIQHDIVSAVTENPAFQVLNDEPRFRALVTKLEALPKPERITEERKK